MSDARSREHPGPTEGPPTTLLGRLGGFVVRRRRWTLIGGLIAILGIGVIAAGAMSAMVLNRWEAPGTESIEAQDVLLSDYETDSSNLILLVTAQNGSVDDPTVVEAAGDLADTLAAEESVGDVWSYWSQGQDATLRSDAGDQALVLAWVMGDATQARADIAEMLPDYTIDNDVINVQVAGSEAISGQISELATQDFVRAELIILPLMLVLLIVVYRRVSPALVTLGVGLFSVLATLAALRGLAAFTEVSNFAANITLVMGIGLGIDYSLFIIARFREELTRGAEVGNAVVTTLQTAGRTVIFSGLTVAASLSVLLAFPFSFLRSFAYAGVLVVITAVLGSLVLLPAALAALGRRVLRGGGRTSAATVQENSETGFWYRTGKLVMRRPGVFGGLALILVAVLGSPVLGLGIGLPDDRVLPESASTRQAYDDLRAGFSQEANDGIHFVVPDIGGPTGSADESINEYAIALSEVDGVSQVNTSIGDYVDGELLRGPGEYSARLVSDTGTRLEAIPSREILSGTDVDGFVHELRAVPAPFDEVLVGGYPAELTDFRSTLMDRVPLVGALILIITFVILFLMSGSLLIPIKATVLNLLSLSVMFGALVFIFQNGNFADVLGFTPIGTLDPAFPILMFCVAYGLSMDYEVFMLSRIKEEYDATGDNEKAVLFGLQRSGPLITSAAIILAVSFSVYATGQIMYLQMIGIGIAVAILIDATLIRAILVPAFMKLAGRANWWAPGPLRKLHDRFGISESGPRQPVEVPQATQEMPAARH
ncbi:MMPL family transporter [Actinoalloteichus hymeniacidonis]|uniref:RND superfamily drug exporter n=1 Tax=Actinoalloteichus hymeniacidonis TaxID=340345 RepID=A0AAC9HU38_9PSEU|nr:MMPL family transporter [Actinoalloteichus hymeniacidonis]AOS65614.1 putative RND superfamily drug exporter [Actinoalloteichus hymeniacidonis]MBB5906296.1 RND superfamily putative drug exporter [Actinoalloteichus hymeniacidonis]